jgi:methylmalonyl-CoA/ethylmalonyl-CoA epimerase
MNIRGIEHIGIAVKDLKRSIEFYENTFGLKCYLLEVVEDQKVNVAFFRIGEVKIELLEPTCSESPLWGFIENRGEGLHHIAYKVDDVNDSLNELKNSGIRLIDRTGRRGAENLVIGFINPRSTFGTLTELCSLHEGD